jgi:pimeloyl-ACP methyl ester carboxylesterase
MAPVRRVLALLLTVALWLGLAVSPGARAHLLTALLLPDLLDLGGPRAIVLVSGAPARRELRLAGADADLYRPTGGGEHGAVVLTLGVHPLDKREPVVVRLAEGLARIGLGVLVVQSDRLMADRIEPDEPGTLVDAFERLAAEPWVAEERVGLVGFSAGASLAFLAATDPRVADRVRLVSWLGGFADAVRLAEEVQSASFLDGAERVPWQPHPLSRYVFRKQLVDALPDPAERARLEAAYVADGGRGDPAAAAALDGLGPEARRLVELFEARDPGEVARLAGELPEGVRARLEALSPLRRADAFRARAHVMVDRSDPLVPYAHSRELARALPPERLARYVEFELFEHVQPTKPVPLGTFVEESWALYRAIAAIVLELDPAAG